MKEQDKREIREIFNQGIEQLVLPQLDKIYDEMATKKDLQKLDLKLREEIDGLGQKVERIDRKFDVEVDWRDRASKRLKNVEIELGLTK